MMDEREEVRRHIAEVSGIPDRYLLDPDAPTSHEAMYERETAAREQWGHLFPGMFAPPPPPK